MKIKTFLIEEHNEAFYIWNYCIAKNLIPSKGNTLLHVDEHSDMAVPRFNIALNQNMDLQSIESFTYNELSIASFLVPCAFLEIFSTINWIKLGHAKNTTPLNKMYVRSYNGEAKKLVMGRLVDLDHGTDINVTDIAHIEFNYNLIVAEEIPYGTVAVLDIDLDYFSCAGNPNENQEIYVEITKDEFDKFHNTDYHRLRFLIPKVEAIEYEGQHYYVFNNYNELYPSPLQKKEQEITARIASFFEQLKLKAIQPLVIDICRSRFSGYTAESQWEFIETKILEGLTQLYDLEIIHVSELRKQEIANYIS